MRGSFEHDVEGRRAIDEWLLGPMPHAPGHFNCWASYYYVDEALAWTSHAAAWARAVLRGEAELAPDSEIRPYERLPTRVARALTLREAFEFFIAVDYVTPSYRQAVAEYLLPHDNAGAIRELVGLVDPA